MLFHNYCTSIQSTTPGQSDACHTASVQCFSQSERVGASSQPFVCCLTQVRGRRTAHLVSWREILTAQFLTKYALFLVLVMFLENKKPRSRGLIILRDFVSES